MLYVSSADRVLKKPDPALCVQNREIPFINDQLIQENDYAWPFL